MQVNKKFSKLFGFFLDNSDNRRGSVELPIRSELFDQEELNNLATKLAKLHKEIINKDGNQKIYERFQQNQNTIENTYNNFRNKARLKESIPPGAEWLLDNYYLICEQIKETKELLPKGYYKQLPKLDLDDFNGLPRVYHLAVEYISHTDALVDQDSLGEFIYNYQKQLELKIGELWAIPIMLRLALIENLRRTAQTITTIHTAKEQAKDFVKEIMQSFSKSGADILLHLANKIKSQKQLSVLGSIYIITELRSHGQKTGLAGQWIEERLAEKDYDLNELLHLEEFLQASNQITIGNTIGSLKNMAIIDWHKWFENVSFLESVLSEDPSGLYQNSNFETRNNCRTEIENTARKLQGSEIQIAKQALELAQSNQNDNQPLNGSLLYYLIGKGRSKFNQKIGLKQTPQAKIKTFLKKHNFLIYALSISIISILAAGHFGSMLFKESNIIFVLILSIASIILISELLIQFTHWILSLLIKPKPLPKLNYERPVSAEHKTIVIINDILSSKLGIDQAISQLEVRYLTNDDPNILFSILADLPEAQQQELPGDQILIEYANQEIKKINKKYLNKQQQRFFLFFRKRNYCQSEEKYMGRERKRGKVAEFNQFLITGNKNDFITEDQDLSSLSNIKYVLTLDADTILPINSVKKLIATIAHPLNRAVLDPEKNVVVDGHALIQPQMLNSLNSINVSYFSKMLSCDSGIDPYSSLVSEIYQDVFDQGTFIGKGIYDLHVFEQVLDPKIPERALLSHDLFEGNLLRCGLASDVTLIENIPSKYNVELSRQHRWTRGDWQLLPWLTAKVPNKDRKPITNPIPKLGLWKIFDNLRRSLLPIFLLCSLLILEFSSSIKNINIYLIIFITIGSNILIQFLDLFFRFRINKNIAAQLAHWFLNLKKNLAKIICYIAFLPKHAFAMLDAILKTIFRLYVSKKKLLEWITADFAEQTLKNDLKTFFKFFWPNYLLIISLGFLCIYTRTWPGLTLTCLALWAVAPLIAYKISQALETKSYDLKLEDQKKIRKIAYDTWKYFDDHLNAEHNYLIPDNLQLVPEKRVAHRTSPTNIGLSMLSVLSAYDLGYISITAAIDKIENIIRNVKKLETFSGQLYNWYNTRTLEPLHPHYISFVDSSNFVAHCLTCKQSLKELFLSPWINNDFLFDRDQLTNNQKLNYLNIYDLLKEHDLYASFYKLHPWIEEIANWPTKDFGKQSEELKNKVDSLLSVIQTKTPSLTLSKKINNRLIEIYETARDSSLKDQDLSEYNEIALLAAQSNQLIDIEAEKIRQLIKDLNNIINNADFNFLYNEEQNIFSVGYNLENAAPDNSYYDLLASEARLGSLTCIALKKVPIKHWFKLGRNLTNTPFGKALYSWTGTTFEYFLPNLLCKDFPNSLITESNLTALQTQIWYGKQKGVPWGVSESAHAGVDFEQTYQYRAFGVPELGLKRGLGHDLVVSPYSTLLTLPYETKKALKNLKDLEQINTYGEYGFFESIDFTPERLSDNEKYHVVQTFFAHHQGMSLAAINNYLNNNIFQKRFHSEPRIKSVELLLHEKFPIATAETIETNEPPAGFFQIDETESGQINRHFYTPYTTRPITHLISNGNTSTLIDNTGNGKLFTSSNLQLNTWQENPSCNPQGIYVYLRDIDSEHLWSNTFQPTCVDPDYYEVIYNPHKVDFKRQDKQINCHTEVTISPEYNLEIRRISITNLSNRKRNIQLTSFSEVALAKEQDFKAHPAFLRTFIESEFIEELDALIFTRKPRNSKEKELYMFHQLSLPICWNQTHYASNRHSFIGRYNDLKQPAALKSAHLDDSAGSILDPVMSLQTIIEVTPGFSANLSFITGYSDSMLEIMNILRLFHHQNSINRTFDLAWSKSNIEIRNENFSIAQTHRFQNLANALFYQLPELTAEDRFKQENVLVKTALWKLGISGDLPIILLKVYDQEEIKIVKELLLAHEFLRRRGVACELVIINNAQSGYFKEFYQQIEECILNSPAGNSYQSNAGVFLREIQNLSDQEVTLLEAVSKISLNASKGSLRKQLEEKVSTYNMPQAIKNITKKNEPEQTKLNFNSNAEFNNSYGAFVEDGKAYQIIVDQKTQPPLPWINVIANPDFGTLISDSGSGYSWSSNSRENKISTWFNDPIKDSISEAIYIRDVDSGSYWSASPKPAAAESDYLIEHHFGFSKFKVENKKIETELTISVSQEKNIKLYKLRITNNSKYIKSLELYNYLELVLGVNRSDNYRNIVINYIDDLDILIATNRLNNEFSEHVTFFGSDHDFDSYSANRKEFVGAQNNLKKPFFLEKAAYTSFTDLVAGTKSSPKLSNKVGVNLDPAFILKTSLDIEAGQTSEITFFLGQEENMQAIGNTVANFSKPLINKIELEQVANFWQEKTSKIQVKTPARSFDILMNGWLVYQNMSCRIYGRSAFYQSGGAFGFRDQLQDSLSTLYIDPELTRKQILLHAARQFEEGDVQHWWHPPTGRGTRTRISDDLLWMPYVVWNYIKVTGDNSILEETVPFITAPILEAEQHDAYLHPQVSQEQDSILEHCLRAIDFSLQFGEHGIPLIRGGDWNDGMDEVGIEGKGESVWLGWFLADILNKFSETLKSKDAEKSESYLQYGKQIVKAIEKHAWDGDWYLRAFYDDGTPLGSQKAEECKIDSLAQSWGIITGLAKTERSSKAIKNVHKLLVDQENRIIKLLTPAFDKTKKSPGYIRSYIPGVRENGAQYTHAACWVILATSMLGDGDKAFDLFQLINPVDITSTQAGVEKYKGEPYVTCGDVLSNEQHQGRAGWSWYTGSGGWLYRVGIEYILGLKLYPDGFELEPTVPKDWKEFEIKLNLEHQIQIKARQTGKSLISVNGIEQKDKRIFYKKLDFDMNQVEVHF